MSTIGREWVREVVSKYSDAIMSILADGEWHRGDEIRAAVLPATHDRYESRSIPLCLDVLAIEKRKIDMRMIMENGMLVDFEFRRRRI